jgi:excisionase family DNA binding protein
VLRVPKARVYELIRQGRLPAVRVGRLVRVPEEELRVWIARGGMPTPDREEATVTG